MKGKSTAIVLCLLLALSFSGCGLFGEAALPSVTPDATVTPSPSPSAAPSPSPSTSPEPEPSPKPDDGRIPAPTQHLYDDFTGGVDPAKWAISTRNWSAAVSNGQKAENVGYTEDGLLVLTANGKYCKSQEMRNTGACLLSKEQLGPGRYEIAMKVLPRLGVCNAFWSFYYESADINHEIDVELPGNKSYENVLNTNWTGETVSTSVASKTASPANDGKWHTYCYEWTTSPAEVKFYVDDELVTTIAKDVPTNPGNLWLGVWLPNSWCGVPDFETDYLLVDWVSYEKYEGQPVRGGVTERLGGIAAPEQYPKEPIALPARNYLSNAGFEGLAEAWQEVAASEIVRGAAEGEFSLSLAAGRSVSQPITAVYGGFRFRLAGMAKASGGRAEIAAVCLDAKGAPIAGGSFTTAVTSSAFQRFAFDFTAPAGTKQVSIELRAVDAAAGFDALEMTMI